MGGYFLDEFLEVYTPSIIFAMQTGFVKESIQNIESHVKSSLDPGSKL